jgi:hypothetical protein
MANLAEKKIQHHFIQDAKRRPGSWGAFTLYFGAKGHIKELYQQVHLNHPEVKNYFVSFSIPNDLTRAPEGYQAVTISTHVYAEESVDKKNLQEIILKDFMVW